MNVEENDDSSMFVVMEVVSEYLSRHCDDLVKEVKSEFSKYRVERKIVMLVQNGNSMISLALQIKETYQLRYQIEMTRSIALNKTLLVSSSTFGVSRCISHVLSYIYLMKYLNGSCNLGKSSFVHVGGSVFCCHISCAFKDLLDLKRYSTPELHEIKVLVEMILRTVPDVGKIYLLIKANDKEAAMERLKNEIIDSDLFKCMEQFYGEFYQQFMLNKLVSVRGNVGEAGLGMEVGLADQIANEVDIIVHSAANTTFDQRLDVSIDINTLGPCRIMSFAKTCKGLKLFMHVSTAYVNGKRRGVITEKPFHMGESIASERAGLEIGHVPYWDVEAEIKLAFDARNASRDNMVTQKMKQLGAERANMHGWHDTYAFAKAMGEMMIDSQREDMPVVIIRPTIIESTYKEPIPGWIEGIRMMDPVILAYGKGELTGFPADAQGVMDMIPVDMVANAMIAAMAKHGTVKGPGLNVYHVASSNVNPLMYKDLFDYVFEYFDSSPYMDLKRGPINIEKAKIINTMDDFYSHIQAEVDRRTANSPQQGSRSLSRRLQRSLDVAKHLAYVYEPYTFYEGRFDNTNMQKLMEEMSEDEQKSFNIDVGSIDWKNYICNIHIPGILRHVQKGRGLQITRHRQ